MKKLFFVVIVVSVELLYSNIGHADLTEAQKNEVSDIATFWGSATGLIGNSSTMPINKLKDELLKDIEKTKTLIGKPYWKTEVKAQDQLKKIETHVAKLEPLVRSMKKITKAIDDEAVFVFEQTRDLMYLTDSQSTLSED